VRALSSSASNGVAVALVFLCARLLVYLPHTGAAGAAQCIRPVV
jgi:hypothetical protein